VRFTLLTVVLAVGCTPNPETVAARCDTGDAPACAKAKEKVQHLCELGHADACHVLAEVYANGRGGPKDPAKAREYFDAACERGRKESCRAAARPPAADRKGPAPVVPVVAAAPEPAAPAPEPVAPAPAPPPPDAAAVAAPEPPKPVKRAAGGPSTATLQRRCEANDEAACMALGKEMIKAEARKNPAAARELLNQMKQACAAGDADACEVIKRGLRGR
jgi:hypothetical protein